MTERPKIHAKHIDVMVSVGTDDRERTIEDFKRDVDRALREVARAHNVVITRPYYILDGKVCLPEDYDSVTQSFKKGATPPAWAGGPTESEKRAKQRDQERYEAALATEVPVRRRVRSDKGTTPTPEQALQVAGAAKDLGEALKEKT